MRDESRGRKPSRRLPVHYRYWLTEDVAEIISPEERCAFLSLADDQERQQFIEQFWICRAPDPQLFENDFKIEHYRRIVEADRQFRVNGSGGETDRGKIYVRYGRPYKIDAPVEELSIENANGAPGLPGRWVARWHYRYIEGLGENVDLCFC